MQKISIIIPTRNEEKSLPRCLSAIRQAQQYAGEQSLPLDVEIVVVINRCTDATESIAVQAGCVVVHEDAKNLSIIRNAGVRASSADFVITVDADSYMSKNMLLLVARNLQRLDVVGGGVLILPERWSLGIFLTILALVPIALWYRISGGLFYFRRTDFEAINGFNPELVSVEDIDFARRLRALGAKTKRRFISIYSAWIITSTRKFDTFGDWFFLLNFRESVRLFTGKDSKAANKIWYDFKH